MATALLSSRSSNSEYALGYLIRECLEKLHLKLRDVFCELSLGAPLLTREALLTTCRTRLGLRRTSLSDDAVEVRAFSRVWSNQVACASAVTCEQYNKTSILWAGNEEPMCTCAH